MADTFYYMLLLYKMTVRTITPDNGPEFAMHKLIAKRLNTKVYFVHHPYCSCEKGAIEYAHKLFRQYIPKKTSFEMHNIQDIKNIQEEINSRPRKKLGYSTPLE